MSAFIDRYSSRQIGLKKNELSADTLKKLSHLYLNEKHIEEIGDLSLCENLKVLYLHNNSIKKIANCHNLTNLTHLYLQWNKICEIQNINGLKNLRKLYLGHNLISCLENISELSQLEELHIERQANPKNGWLNFRFEANSLRGIANTLKVLNISGLELTKLSDLQLLKQLRELNACNNQFENAGDLALCLEQMPYLTIVNLKGCPAQKNDRHYRDKIITSCRVLDALDDKQVSDRSRHFLQKLEQVKAEKNARKLSEQHTMQAAEDEMVEKLTSIFSRECFNRMESECLDMIPNTHDELSFKAWQSLKLKDSRNLKKTSKNIRNAESGNDMMMFSR